MPPDNAIESSSLPRRVLADLDSGTHGTRLVIIAGTHGNEPAGCTAALRVSAQLEHNSWLVRGRIRALAGNVLGLSSGRRFVDEDLNRGWTHRALSHPPDKAAPHERHERNQLLQQFSEICQSHDEPCVFLDLHTTSAQGPAFVCMADVLRNRRYARALGLPIILGLEEVIQGSMLGYLCDHGHIGIAVEGGRHDDPRAIDQLENVIWVTLSRADVLAPEAAARVDEAAQALHRATKQSGLRPFYEILYRHSLAPDHAFTMTPSFTNFDRVRAGRVLAHEGTTPICAPHPANVILPLYQSEGDDGFFLARPVAGFWLSLSTILRKSPIVDWVHRFPGVQCVNAGEDEGKLRIDTRVARVGVRGMFHLLGFRLSGCDGPVLEYLRRRPDSADLVELDWAERRLPAGTDTR